MHVPNEETFMNECFQMPEPSAEANLQSIPKEVFAARYFQIWGEQKETFTFTSPLFNSDQATNDLMVTVERRSSASHPGPHMLSHYQKWRRHNSPSESFQTHIETDESIRLTASTLRVPENQHTDASIEVLMKTSGSASFGSTVALPGNYGSIRGTAFPGVLRGTHQALQAVLKCTIQSGIK
ncbi:uncharacterized protein BT62DRAFT_1076999 [Guyanagaster necrorhizus]|uniref:Uncharacterized protein n=1 Tax=Guyanagaster necrorhizus TaxID=856835 RepID=A0A9P8ASX5_9AGAR|nr:uncharacterized protein BT62DRAFT_1076999 [Guyanagaster necrorhizus MCA 3950]KAG7445312.1 hypothetical protein BT62DRAFT_1076999 [Guyanagaster necrorhizus MCA 3950]